MLNRCWKIAPSRQTLPRSRPQFAPANSIANTRSYERETVNSRATRARAQLQRLAPGSRHANADEQSRSGSRGSSGSIDRLRRHRTRGADQLAATMNGACFIGVEVDPMRIQKRLATGYCDHMAKSLDQALQLVDEAGKAKRAVSVGLVGNCADVLPEMVKRNFVPDLLTDQTSAHDALNGYVPNQISLADAIALRAKNPEEYVKRSMEAMAEHVRAMLELQKRGAITFDYGNNIRTQAKNAGVENAYDIPGFVPEYIRPLFCEGKGPFRWVALSGNPDDIARTDALALELFPENAILARWMKLAKERIHFQGLPARICWLGYGERAEFGVAINELVRRGEVKAPIVIGRDHLDTGSVASPFRETEGMLDGSDAIADWPLLNALVNTAAGASWISVHNGGGVGIGYSQHAGMVVVADGTDNAKRRLERVLTSDPGMGILRHADAGYSRAIDFAAAKKIDLPMAPRACD